MVGMGTGKSLPAKVPGHHQPNVPLLGYVDEKDPKVMAMKIDAAADNEIDCFIFDWYIYEDGPPALRLQRSVGCLAFAMPNYPHSRAIASRD